MGPTPKTPNAGAEGAPRSEATREPNSGPLLGAPLEPMVSGQFRDRQYPGRRRSCATAST